MSTWQFAQEELAKPLGFTLAKWTADPQGIYFGGNEMLMTPRQMIAFGELYLNDGKRRRSAADSEGVDRSDARAGAGDRAGAAIANTATASGSASSPATTVITRGATAGSSSSSFPDKDLVVVTTSRCRCQPRSGAITDSTSDA